MGNDLALRIVKELARHPCCAIDIARKLKVHEQKVYYHMRKLEKYGFIYSVSSERRYGMIAHIYNVVSPVVATKLFEGGVEVKDNFSLNVSKEVLDFFHPFVEDGRMNAKVVVGDPYPHGKYDEPARESAHLFDFGMMMGSLVRDLSFPYYKLDTETSEKDLKNNLILIGNAWTNVVVDNLNGKLPIYFDSEKRSLLSKVTGRTYKEPTIGIIVKCDNPYCEGKNLLVISGIRTRGMEACMIAITQYINTLMKKDLTEGPFMRIIEGLDRDGDKNIDAIRILE